MKILANSILIIPEFIEFSKTLCGGNYVVNIEAITFSYYGMNKTVDIHVLRDIFPEEAHDIDGKIVEINWDECTEEISKILQYSEYHEVLANAKKLGKDTVSDDLHKQRIDFFWETVRKHISLPPKKIYKHIPNGSTFFADFMMWGFCHILLNDNKGIVIYGLSYD